MATISGVEVAQHNTVESYWIVLYDAVWDVTNFLSEHPGGRAHILKSAGEDATASYDEVHEPDLVTMILSPKACLGTADTTKLPQKASKAKNQGTTKYPPLNTVVSVADFETIAQSFLTPAGWAYYSSGAEDEYSIEDAFHSFRQILLRPRVFRQVEPVSTGTTILGCSVSLPVYFSPTGIGRYAHRNTECIMTAVAGKEGLIYCMPTSSSWESVCNARSVEDQPLFFQLYTCRDKEHTTSVLRELKKLGVAAILLTVDSPVLGKRERDDGIRAADGQDTITDSAGGVAKATSKGLLNPLLSWDDIEWIRDATGLPLVLKGVQTVEELVPEMVNTERAELGVSRRVKL
ncbi:unnamed protein product [Fusarium graminearum]|uniref:Cytochrome b5 heme-binding domain-containing protein n=1 Tax=Gibberella zeae TaxID=5518 RepID=A0A9N8R5F5_GIBZA|nr:unnamed protein product [Fusarium graminearum]